MKISIGFVLTTSGNGDLAPAHSQLHRGGSPGPQALQCRCGSNAASNSIPSTSSALRCEKFCLPCSAEFPLLWQGEPEISKMTRRKISIFLKSEVCHWSQMKALDTSKPQVTASVGRCLLRHILRAVKDSFSKLLLKPFWMHFCL